MERDIMRDLLNWKQSEWRKPLLLQGARQVGKTYILKEFGKNHFASCHYLNLEDKRTHDVFMDGIYDIKKIIFRIESLFEKVVDLKNDLIILDEIQDFPEAISSLKYFFEDLPELSICCAGSHIGIFSSDRPFPVGKVDFLTLRPMSFSEFLKADNPILHKGFSQGTRERRFDQLIHNLLWEELKKFYTVGGMPEAVKRFLSGKDHLYKAFSEARSVHQSLIESYKLDFAKYSGKINSERIAAVFNNIPSQIQKVYDDSVKRYRFKGVLPKLSKFPQLHSPIEWLIISGLAIKVKIVNKSERPLEAYSKENHFKLLMFDVGILSTMLDLSFVDIMNQDYGSYKGFIAENFVAQELLASGEKNIYSWSEGKSEIEFLTLINDKIVPVEVKSGTRVRAKSLKAYNDKYQPEISVKLSVRNLIINESRKNLPIYLAGSMVKLLTGEFSHD